MYLEPRNGKTFFFPAISMAGKAMVPAMDGISSAIPNFCGGCAAHHDVNCTAEDKSFTIQTLTLRRPQKRRRLLLLETKVQR